MYTDENKTKTLLTRIGEIVGEIIMCTVVGLLFAWLLVNWVSGCGEIIYTATGSYMGECIYMPWGN